MDKLSLVLNDRVRILKERKISRRHTSVLKRTIADELASFEVGHEIRIIQDKGVLKFEVELQGVDAIAASNYLKLRHGDSIEKDELKEGMLISYARWDKPGSVGFGTFLDIGIADTNALYPLFRMREQLASGTQIPVKWFEKVFGFCDGFATEVIIREISSEGKIFADLSDRMVQEFTTWRQDGCDRVLCHGETTVMVERALRKAGAKPERTIVQETAFLDSIITCDKRTDGAGIVALVGRALPHLSMGVFNADDINEKLK